jgi:two-component sensor histidine kinase
MLNPAAVHQCTLDVHEIVTNAHAYGTVLFAVEDINVVVSQESPGRRKVQE